MKRIEGRPFDQWRDRSAAMLAHYGNAGDETCGVFNALIDGHIFRVIASSGLGWDHVSASLPNRCPTWDEMVEVKRAFFKHDEWAIEFHPPQSENINKHPFCLHLWRPQLVELPYPPRETVA